MQNQSSRGAQADSQGGYLPALNKFVEKVAVVPYTRHQIASFVQSELPFLAISLFLSCLFYRSQGDYGYAELTTLACFSLTHCVIYSIREKFSNQYQLVDNNVNEKIDSIKAIKVEFIQKVEEFEAKIDKKVSTISAFLLMVVLLCVTAAILLIGSYAFINFYAGISGLFYLAHTRIDHLNFFPSECLYLLVLALLAVGSNFGLTLYVSGHLHTVLQIYLPILIATCSLNVTWVSGYPVYAYLLLTFSVALPTLLVYLHYIGMVVSGVFWLPLGVSIFASLFNIISFFQALTEIKTDFKGSVDHSDEFYNVENNNSLHPFPSNVTGVVEVLEAGMTKSSS
jgi:hypothetical protein